MTAGAIHAATGWSEGRWLAGPVFGAERSGLAMLLLVGWLGLTVLGSLLHLLSVLVQVRVPSRAHLPPHGDGSGAVAALACVGVVGLTVGLLLPLGALVLPAALALGAAYAFLLARVVVLAGRALAHGGIRV